MRSSWKWILLVYGAIAALNFVVLSYGNISERKAAKQHPISLEEEASIAAFSVVWPLTYYWVVTEELKGD